MSKKGYYFVTKNNKKNLILMLIILVVSCVILAVISLIPNRFKDKWLNTDNGVARSSMFPFVYTTDNSLFILNDQLETVEIDDSVSDCIHDVNFNMIYYLRDNKLYEYDIDTNKRVSLSEGVANFRLFSERTSILCTNNVNDLYLYLYKNKGNIKLNKSSLENVSIDSLYEVGTGNILFLDNFNFENNTASLMCSDLDGNVKCLANDIDATKSFNISSDDKYALYYKGKTLFITDLTGNVLQTFDNSNIIHQSEQHVLTEPCTTVNYYSEGVPFLYFLVNISENGNSGDLVYYTEEGIKNIDTEIKSIVHFYEDGKLLLYTKDEHDGTVSLYKCIKGDNPTKLITCNSSDNFFFNEDSSFLYIQSSEGFLRRINIFDNSLKVTDVSEGSGVLFDYFGKSFVGYHDLDGESQYLILNTNSIEKFAMNEIRYYGKYSNKFLLCREYQQGKFSLDYTSDGYTTRIANNVDKNIFFDKEFNYVIFSNENKLYIWTDNTVSQISDCSNISAVSVIATR
ncbi:MAG: hypothetical protein IJZ94_03130 [Clostridia bacterium]|nr:hypothetical protein [Clostridia bacterium]